MDLNPSVFLANVYHTLSLNILPSLENLASLYNLEKRFGLQMISLSISFIAG